MSMSYEEIEARAKAMREQLETQRTANVLASLSSACAELKRANIAWLQAIKEALRTSSEEEVNRICAAHFSVKKDD